MKGVLLGIFCAQQQAKVVGATVVEKTDEDFLSRCVVSFSCSTVMITVSETKIQNCELFVADQKSTLNSTSAFCLQWSNLQRVSFSVPPFTKRGKCAPYPSYIYMYPCHCMNGFNMQQNLTILSSLWSSLVSLFPQFFWPCFGSLEGTKNGCLESQGRDHLMSCR